MPCYCICICNICSAKIVPVLEQMCLNLKQIDTNFVKLQGLYTVHKCNSIQSLKYMFLNAFPINDTIICVNLCCLVLPPKNLE